MVVKRFLALTMAGLLAVTSVNTGSIKAYAQEPEQVVLENSQEETEEEALDQIADEEAETEAVYPNNEEDEAEAEVQPVEDEALTEEDGQAESEPAAEETETETDADEETVEVTFNAEGGYFENEEDTLSLNITKGTTIEDLEAPEREGFSFEGWFLDEEYTQPVDLSSFAFVENAVLFAKWQEITDEDAADAEIADDLLEANSYELILHGNGGTFSDGKTTYTVTSRTKYLENYAPVRDGKIFIGWFSDAECTNSLSSTSDPYDLKNYAESGTEIYAGWSDYYIITYVFGTEQGTDPVKNTGYYWDHHTKSRLKSMEIKVPVGSGLSGYTPSSYSSYVRNTDLHYGFTKWYKDEDRTEKINSLYSFVPSGPMKIYAGFENNRKIATVHANSDTAYSRYEVYEYSEVEGKYENCILRSYTKSSNGYQLYLSEGDFENTNLRMAFGGFYYDKACSEDKKIDDYYIYLQDDVELWIKWVPTNKLVTFDVNGGYFREYDNATEKYVNSTDPVTVGTDGERDHFNPGTLQRDDQHYRFAGWSTNKNATAPDEGLANDPSDDDGSFGFYATFTEDTKLYAVWSKEYIVATFDAGKGKLRQYKDGEYIQVKSYSSRIKDGRPQNYPSDSEVTAPTSGEIFSAWYVGDKKVTEGFYSYEYTEDVTFTAHYATKYTITLKANGGYFEKRNSETDTYDHLPEKTLDVAAGQSVYLSTPKIDEDKEFGGWCTDTALTKPVPQSYTPTSSITLYAKWLPKHKVTLNYGEGTVDGKSSDTKAIAEGYTVEKGFSSIANPDFASDEKAFEGWYTDPEFNNRIEKSDILATVVTEDITFYARFVQAFKVTFDAGDGSFRSKEGTTYTVKVADGQAVGSKAPTMVSTERNVFEGWYVKVGEEEKEIPNIYSYKITADITFYAKYTKCYILTFHANQDGALLDGQTTVKIQVTKGTAFRYGKAGEEKDVLYNAPALDYSNVDLTQAMPFVYRYNDKTFGWSTKPDGSGDTYYLGSSGHFYYTEDGSRHNFNMYGFVPTGDMDFYARWGVPVSVIFDPNGGTFKTGSSYDQYGTLNAKGQRVQKVPKGSRYTDVKEPSSDSANPPSNKDVNYVSWGYTGPESNSSYIGSYTPILEDTIVYGRWFKSSSGSGSGSSTSKTVTLHAKDGYFSSVSNKTSTTSYSSLSTTSTHSTTIPNIADPNKAFLGWYYDDALTKPYPAEYQFYRSGSWYIIIPKDITDLYAKYGPAFTVKLDANGGYFDKNSDRTKDPDEVMRDSTVLSVKQKVSGKGIVISDYTKRVRRDGDKLFDGWYKDANAETKALTFTEDSNYEYFIPKENCVLYAGWNGYELPEEISISAPGTISVGEEVAVSATIKPSSFSKEDLHWYVSDYSYSSKDNPLGTRPAVLSCDGKLTGQAAGTVNIYAELNGRMSNIVKVTVSNKAVEQSISLDKTTINLVKNGTATVTATVTPASDASKVTWSTSNNKVAKVDGNGTVAIITAGDTEGTAVVKATLGSKTAQVTVNVSVPIRLDYNTASLTYKEGKTFALKATPADEFAGKNIVWESSNTEVLTVAASGTTGAVVSVNPGKELLEETPVTITATLEGTEYSDKCEFTVRPVGVVGIPTADVQSGDVKPGTVVNLTSATPGAEIFFTSAVGEATPADPVLNDGVPAEGTALCVDAFVINETTTIKAVAYKEGLVTSQVSTFTFTVNDDDWGYDIEHAEADLKAYLQEVCFGGKASSIPDDIWFVFRTPFGGFQYMTGGGITEIIKEYNGGKITFDGEIVVFYSTRRLIENRDYTVTYANNTLAADKNATKAPTFTIKGKGQFNNAEQFTFTIDKADINEAEITAEKTVTVIAGNSTKLGNTKPVVTFGGKKLNLGKDYVLNYYKGEAVDAAKLIADPAKEIISDTSSVYTIEVAATDTGNFREKMAETVTVVPVMKAANIVQASKLKVGDAKGKALTVSYSGEKVDLDALFDNSTAEKTPVAFVKNGKTTLVYGTDFTVVELPDEDYKSAGTANFVIRGVDKSEAVAGGASDVVWYAGDKFATLTIAGVAVNKAKVAGLKTTVEYTGNAITLDDLFNSADKTCAAEKWNAVTLYTVINKVKTPLEKDKDYEVSLANTGITGKFDLVFTGINGCTGSLKKTITVKAHAIKGDDFKVTAADTTYVKSGAKPKVTVTYKEETTLVEGIDYTVTYKNNAQVAGKDAKKAPTAVVKGIGNYTGSGASATFSIDKANISENVKVTVNDVAYNASKSGKSGYFLAVPKLFDDGKAVTVGKNKDIDAIAKSEYKYTYKFDTVLTDGTPRSSGDTVFATDKVPAGTTIEVAVPVKISSAKSPYKADKAELTGCYKVIDKSMDISKFVVQIKDESKSKLSFHNGDEIKLTKHDLVVGVKSGKTVVPIDEQYYEIQSITGNRFLGTATITVVGKGNYGGSKKITCKVTAKSMK